MIKQRNLGRTGRRCAELGLGTWAFGGAYGPLDDRSAEEVLEEYLAAGGNLIDTARGYPRAEETLGRALARYPRDGFILCTKTHGGATRDTLGYIRADLEASLEALRLDHVDVYYLHSPPEDPDLMRWALDEMSQLRDEGKVEMIGASIKGPDVSLATTALCEQYINTSRVHVIQVVFSILRQQCADIFGLARRAGVGIVARSVLESGFLSGHHSLDEELVDHRARWRSEKKKAVFAAVEHLKTYALPQGFRSLVDLAIPFALRAEDVSCALIGAKSRTQARANLAAAALPPLPDDVTSLLRREFAGLSTLFNTSPEDPAITRDQPISVTADQLAEGRLPIG
jgi:aryl-alcohol dehydrogenase-like predicted oxidoreductase